MEREVDVRPVHRETSVDQLINDLMTADDIERILGYAGEPSECVGTPETLAAALSVIGAWEGMEPWEVVEEELYRIRHGSVPTPPIQ